MPFTANTCFLKTLTYNHTCNVTFATICMQTRIKEKNIGQKKNSLKHHLLDNIYTRLLQNITVLATT